MVRVKTIADLFAEFITRIAVIEAVGHHWAFGYIDDHEDHHLITKNGDRIANPSEVDSSEAFRSVKDINPKDMMDFAIGWEGNELGIIELIPKDAVPDNMIPHELIERLMRALSDDETDEELPE